MHVASVTLDEVLRAASGRAAALVPETAGYLALAIGDASARLPYRVEDDLVTLTTEGTVRVARGREAVAPEEGARVLRDHLRRLLSVSAGSMPGLAQAGTARTETTGPEGVIAEVEAALIPVNRAAARRSLARLARDVSKARDQGRLAAKAPPCRGAAAPAPKAAQRISAANGPRAASTANVPSQASAGEAASALRATAPEPRFEALPAATFEPSFEPSYEPGYDARYEAAPEPRFEALPEARFEARFEPSYDVDVTFEPEPLTPAQTFVPTVSAAWPQIEEPTCRIALPTSSPVARPTWVDSAAVAEAAAVESEPIELHDPTTLDPDVLHVIEASMAEAGAHPRPEPESMTEPGAELMAEPGAELMAEPMAEPDATPRLGTPVPRAILAASSAASPEPPPPARTPAMTSTLSVDEAALALDAHLRSGRLGPATPLARPAPPRQRRPPWQAELRRAAHSDVDALLASFRPSNPREDATTMRRDLKKLVGVDATQLPPQVVTRTGSS